MQKDWLVNISMIRKVNLLIEYSSGDDREQNFHIELYFSHFYLDFCSEMKQNDNGESKGHLHENLKSNKIPTMRRTDSQYL